MESAGIILHSIKDNVWVLRRAATRAQCILENHIIEELWTRTISSILTCPSRLVDRADVSTNDRPASNTNLPMKDQKITE